MIDRNCRKFEREALKCLRQLPDKQSIPPVSDMGNTSLYHDTG